MFPECILGPSLWQENFPDQRTYSTGVHHGGTKKPNLVQLANMLLLFCSPHADQPDTGGLYIRQSWINLLRTPQSSPTGLPHVYGLALKVHQTCRSSCFLCTWEKSCSSSRTKFKRQVSKFPSPRGLPLRLPPAFPFLPTKVFKDLLHMSILVFITSYRWLLHVICRPCWPVETLGGREPCLSYYGIPSACKLWVTKC